MNSAASRLSADAGFTLVELMVSIAISLLLILAALTLYVPVSRALLDQTAIARQTHAQGTAYDFHILNITSAGFGVTQPTVNTDLVLVMNGTQVTIPPSGSASGNGLFWDWQPVPGGTPTCGGVAVAAATTASTTNQSLLYYVPTASNSCTGNYWSTAQGPNSATYWNTLVVMPDLTSGAQPLSVSMGTACQARDSLLQPPILHPQVRFLLPVAQLLTQGFFQHSGQQVPGTVCLANF